ncbi:hypothetical protein BYT27DRAFT_6482898 [Phlegmacium glaucopus]|nr:hypothetical protein BYT27DRAFT_6482898 [Phlegmacium glaucopus]
MVELSDDRNDNVDDDNHQLNRTVHRLLLSFHDFRDDPGSSIPNRGTRVEVKESHLDMPEFFQDSTWYPHSMWYRYWWLERSDVVSFRSMGCSG